MMPVIWILLRMLGGLLVRLGPMLVSSVLKAVGVSVVTFVGMDIALTAAHNLVKSNLSGLPAYAVGVLGLLRFDVAVEIIFAGIAGRLAMDALNGSVKRLKVK
jgi:Protein of unknown function (DUF2523)